MKTPTGIPITLDRAPGDEERFHLVGIGGAGMSALARWLVRRGWKVSGSELSDSPLLVELRALGIDAYVGHEASQVGAATWLVVSDAIPPDNPEVQEAQRRGMPLWRRSQLLGWLLQGYRVVAVGGTHGKTTTTALIAYGLIAGGFDPWVVLGGELLTQDPQWQGNIRFGAGQWAVVEACEAYESFLDLQPSIAVITNIEPDHLDYHGTYENLLASFVHFCQQVDSEGLLLACGDDAGVQQLAKRLQRPLLTYGFDPSNHLQVLIKEQMPTCTRFELVWRAGSGRFTPHAWHFASEFELSLPGSHNVLNAAAAAAVAQWVGISPEAFAQGLREFGGVKRRLEVVGELQGITILDDYAHHPSEIVATLQAVRQRYGQRRLVVIFQPHLYSRTRDLLPGFVESLSHAEEVFITDIYPAREAPIPGVSAALIAEGLLERGHSAVRYLPVKNQIAGRLIYTLQPGDVVLTMGAGDVDQVAYELKERLQTRVKRGRLKVAVVLGGDSTEREVSLISGGRVLEALDPERFETLAVDPALLRSQGGRLGLLDLLERERPDVAFLALHGQHGEDGAIQGLLELLGIPYTGSGVLASALAMNKGAAKILFRAIGLTVPNGFVVRRGEPQILERIRSELHLPLIVKPNEGGSTIGVSRVDEWDHLMPALAKAFTYDQSALVEEMIEGTEISAAVLGNREVEVLPLVEIVPRRGFYDFEAKYTPGATEEIVPARLSEIATRRAQQAAALAHRALGCRGMSRVDMIVRQEEPYVLEVNTIPGLTPTSLLPRCAQAAGVSFSELVEQLIELALEAWAQR